MLTYSNDAQLFTFFLFLKVNLILQHSKYSLQISKTKKSLLAVRYNA